MDTEDDGFRAYFAAQLPVLLRFAYLLTDDFGEAEDLTQTALARTFMSPVCHRRPRHRLRQPALMSDQTTRTAAPAVSISKSSARW
jgi:DNA-directed RNA polymerase specialized sigma24 family protein